MKCTNCLQENIDFSLKGCALYGHHSSSQYHTLQCLWNQTKCPSLCYVTYTCTLTIAQLPKCQSQLALVLEFSCKNSD